MTSGLIETASYAWSLDEVLGEGATGAVFRAIHKKTGDFFAVKTFNLKYRLIPQDIRMREFDILSRLNHPNIVCLLAIEEEILSNNKVLVMELCSGGSLHDILYEPRNACGLEEAEYLRVQSHVAAGMQHLREQQIVHRDIKPGNIMKFLTEDGQSLYKLADFGAARELQPEEEFKSLYGTEEYLHPKMYKKAVLRSSMDGSFSAVVDLWSVGVTFYHVATGQLPFRPYGGRSGRETMYQITSQKESGVISGVQLTENGPIEWSQSLSEACRLSVGLRSLVTPLLARLMECNAEKMWQFEDFFDEVKTISNKHVVHVFNVKSSRLIHIYLDPDSWLHCLQQMIDSQTGISPKEQMLLFDGKTVDLSCDASCSFPTTSESPIFLFTQIHNNDFSDFFINIPALPTEVAGVSAEGDYRYSVGCCEVVHYIHRNSSEGVHSHRLLRQAAKMLWTIMIQEAKSFFASLEKEEAVMLELKRRFDHLIEGFIINNEIWHQFEGMTPCGDRTTKYYEDGIGDYVISKQEMRDKLFSEVLRIKQCVEQRLDRFTLDEAVTDFVMKESSSSEFVRNVQLLDLLVIQIETVQQEFKEDRKRGILGRGKELLHKFKKQNLTSNILKAQTVLRDFLLPGLKEAFLSFHGWYSLIETIKVQMTELRKDLDTLIMERLLLADDLDKLEIKHHRQTREFLSSMQSLQSISHSTRQGVCGRLNRQSDPQPVTLEGGMSYLHIEDGFVLVMCNKDHEILQDQGQFNNIFESLRNSTRHNKQTIQEAIKLVNENEKLISEREEHK